MAWKPGSKEMKVLLNNPRSLVQARALQCLERYYWCIKDGVESRQEAKLGCPWRLAPSSTGFSHAHERGCRTRQRGRHEDGDLEPGKKTWELSLHWLGRATCQLWPWRRLIAHWVFHVGQSVGITVGRALIRVPGFASYQPYAPCLAAYTVSQHLFTLMLAIRMWVSPAKLLEADLSKAHWVFIKCIVSLLSLVDVTLPIWEVTVPDLSLWAPKILCLKARDAVHTLNRIRVWRY